MFLVDSIILFSSLFGILKISKLFQVQQKIIVILFIYRNLIALIYVQLARIFNLDAFGYYTYAELNVGEASITPGFHSTNFISYICLYFQRYLNLSIISTSLIFTFVGTIGIIVYLSSINELSINIDSNVKKLSQLIVLFPTLNLWTSCIGKDALTFTCINLVIYSLIKLKPNLKLLIISSLFFILVRPYVGIFLIVGLMISFSGKLNLSIINKFLLIIFSIVGLFLTNQIAFDFLQFENLSDLSETIELFQKATMTGNNSVDLASLSLPLQLFTFMFRPLFFDAEGIYPFLMSFENIILLLIFTYPFLKIIRTRKLKLQLNAMILFLVIFLSFNWIFFSMTVANLGTANRYKLMFLPALVLLSIIYSKNSKNTSRLKFIP